MANKLNIKMTTPEGLTLHTEGTFCEADIAVVPHLESITVTPTTEVQNITPSEGYVGIGAISVTAVSGDPTLIEKEITENGTYEASADGADGFSKVVVNIPTSGSDSLVGARKFVDVPSIDKITPSNDKQFFDLEATVVLGNASGVIKKIWVFTTDDTQIISFGYVGDIYFDGELMNEDLELPIYSLWNTTNGKDAWLYEEIAADTGMEVTKEVLQTLNITKQPADEVIASFLQVNTVGGCPRNHVIEVDELPTENIDTNAVYKMDSLLQDVIVCEDGQAISFVEMAAAEGAVCTCNTIPTKTTEGIKISNMTTAPALHFYYIKDEKDVFVYGDFDKSGENRWAALSDTFGAPCNGTISKASEATETGYYALLAGSTLYRYVDFGFVDVIEVESDGRVWSHKDSFPLLSSAISMMFIDVMSKPTSNIVDSYFNNDGARFAYYYVRSENALYTYTTSSGWIPQSFNECISDRSEATKPDCTYVLLREGFEPMVCQGDIPQPVLASKTVTPSSSRQVLSPVDDHAHYYNEVTVEPIPSSYIIPSGSTTITENGTHNVKEFSSAVVNVPRIIEVDALPTIGLDTDAFYHCGGKYYKLEIGESNTIVGIRKFHSPISRAGLNLVFGNGSDPNVFYLDFAVGGVIYDSIGFHSNTYISYRQSTNSAANIKVYHDYGYWDYNNLRGAYQTVEVLSIPENEVIKTWVENNSDGFHWVEYIKPEGTLELVFNNIEAEFPIDCSQYAKVTVNTAEPLKISDPTVLDNITDSPWGVGGNVFLYEGANTDTYENGTLYYLEDTDK